MIAPVLGIIDLSKPLDDQGGGVPRAEWVAGVREKVKGR